MLNAYHKWEIGTICDKKLIKKKIQTNENKTALLDFSQLLLSPTTKSLRREIWQPTETLHLE